MASLIDWLRGLNLSTAADILGVIGFFVTVYVAVSVRNLRRSYVFRAVVPGHVDKLTETATLLNDCLSSSNKVQALHTATAELARAEATLEALTGLLGWRHSKSAKILLKTIQTYKREPSSTTRPDTEALRPIYNDLQKVIRQMEVHLEAREWEKL